MSTTLVLCPPKMDPDKVINDAFHIEVAKVFAAREPILSRLRLGMMGDKWGDAMVIRPKTSNQHAQVLSALRNPYRLKKFKAAAHEIGGLMIIVRKPTELFFKPKTNGRPEVVPVLPPVPKLCLSKPLS